MPTTLTGRTPPTPDGRPTLEVEHPRPAPPRRQRHLAANACVVAYLAAAVVAAAIPDLTPMPRWVALHLLLLGAATNAILTWGTHFADAMLHSRDVGPRAAIVRLVVLNVGVLAVVVGVAGDVPAVVVAGTAAVIVGAVMYGGRIARLAVRGVTGRLAVTVWYYVGAAAALVAGATIGGLLGAGVVHSHVTHEALHAAHVHANVLGWIGLTVLGTEFMMWPAVLRTRMADAAPAVARWVLVVCGTGVVISVAALVLGADTAAAAGVAVYAAGVGLSLYPFARALRNRTAYASPAAAWAMGMSTLWFVVWLVVDVIGLAAGGGHDQLDSLVPLLAIGFIAQVLVGALTFLLPVVLGGGPHGNRRLGALLSTWWLPRLAVANVGILLLALPVPDPVHTAGLVLALVGLGSFIPLAAVALLSRTEGQPRLHLDPLEVVAVTALATVLTLLAAVIGGALPRSDASKVSGPVVADITLADFTIVPATLTAPAERDLVVRVHNAGQTEHDLRVDARHRTRLLAPGETQVVDLGRITEATTAYCTVGGHRAAGMELAIRPATSPAGHVHAAAPGGAHDMGPLASPGAGWTPRDAVLPAAPATTVHNVTLHVRETTLEVAPGVRQQMWTFGGTVPGPVLRGHVGDEFIVTLVNDGTMKHSIDFHASMVAPDTAMRSIAPGERLVYRFRAEHAGIWMYHCGTAPLLQHVANGMYGAVVIDPPSLPPVAREYVLVQSEVYLGAGGALPALSKVRDIDYDHVLFNGYADQYTHAPLTARVGERVRVWVLDAGPSVASAFHVVGTQFDTVYKEGAYQLRPSADRGAAQVLDLGAAQGGFVEMTFPARGRYPFLTHRLADASRGAAGVFDVTG